MLTVGAIIGGRYRIEGLCGSGSFGSVYLARNLRSGRKWAVKEIPKEKEGREGYCPAENEVRSLRKLSHPNLASLADVFETPEAYLIFTDYIEGITLNEYVRAEREGHKRKISPETVLWLAREIAEGLCYLQDNGLIHGDLKPGNIMIDGSFRPVIIDLGGAVRIEKGRTAHLPVWTKGFSPPEAENGIADPTTDIWSFGAVIRYLLEDSAKSPEKGGEEGRLKALLPKSRSREEQLLDAALKRIADQCMKRRPEDRYRSFHDVLRELEDPCRTGEQIFRKKRRFKAAFRMLLAAIPLFCALSVYGGEMKMRAEGNAYRECLIQAGRSSREEAVQYYRLAVMIRPQDKEAYLGLIDLLCEDNELTDEEDAIITETMNAVEYNRKVRNGDMLKACEEQYLPVAYRLGTAYYYCTDDLLKEAAVKYLSDVAEAQVVNLDLGISNEKKENWQEQCAILGKMIRYENRLGRGNYRGEEEVTYLDYWIDLDALICRAEEKKEEDVTVLWCVRDLLTKICSYTDRFFDAGVSCEEMKRMISRAEKLAGENSRNTGIRKKELKETIRGMAEQAFLAVDSFQLKTVRKEAG